MDGLDHLFIEKEQKQRIKEQCGDVFKTVDKELAKLKEKIAEIGRKPSSNLKII